jgi:Tfp pilus assembly protein PilF/predicted aspartyl protease
MPHKAGFGRLSFSEVLSSVLLFLTLALSAAAQETTPQPSPPDLQKAPPPPSSVPASSPSAETSVVPRTPLGEAMDLALKGDCDAAIKKYQQVLEERPKSPDAYAGITRCYLKNEDVTRASETITKGMQVADGWPVRVALGEVYFRQGKIPEAEKEWVNVINSGHPAARAYLGLARVRWAIAMNKSANRLIDTAHQLDPDDPDIQHAWISSLRRSDRIQYYERFLAEANSSDGDERKKIAMYLSTLKDKGKQTGPSCRLVSKVTNTTTPLVRLLLDPSHLRGYGLSVDLNGTRTNILLDTGASGIVVKRRIAEKAGITKVTETKIWGIGDKGMRNAYVGTAKSIRIGELEFQGCPVEVMEGRSVADEDGLIGADVFEDFLVDIDFPDEKLKLSELPKRPGQRSQQLTLKSDEDDSDSDSGSDSSDQATTQKASADAKSDGRTESAAGSSSGPQDRYIAPEMQSFTHVFRFGHDLLIPTKIGDVPGKLFLLDTGAFNNAISPAAAREVTKVHGDSDTTVKGISGSVRNVYSASKAVLQFGHLKQENQDMTSFDTTSLSNSAGVEISGFLGFVMLHFLDIKIDYRDALIDFSYDEKRFERYKSF